MIDTAPINPNIHEQPTEEDIMPIFQRLLDFSPSSREEALGDIDFLEAIRSQIKALKKSKESPSDYWKNQFLKTFTKIKHPKPHPCKCCTKQEYYITGGICESCFNQVKQHYGPITYTFACMYPESDILIRMKRQNFEEKHIEMIQFLSYGHSFQVKVPGVVSRVGSGDILSTGTNVMMVIVETIKNCMISGSLLPIAKLFPESFQPILEHIIPLFEIGLLIFLAVILFRAARQFSMSGSTFLTVCSSIALGLVTFITASRISITFKNILNTLLTSLINIPQKLILIGKDDKVKTTKTATTIVGEVFGEAVSSAVKEKYPTKKTGALDSVHTLATGLRDADSIITILRKFIVFIIDLVCELITGETMSEKRYKKSEILIDTHYNTLTEIYCEPNFRVDVCFKQEKWDNFMLHVSEFEKDILTLEPNYIRETASAKMRSLQTDIAVERKNYLSHKEALNSYLPEIVDIETTINNIEISLTLDPDYSKHSSQLETYSVAIPRLRKRILSELTSTMTSWIARHMDQRLKERQDQIQEIITSMSTVAMYDGRVRDLAAKYEILKASPTFDNDLGTSIELQHAIIGLYAEFQELSLEMITRKVSPLFNIYYRHLHSLLHVDYKTAFLHSTKRYARVEPLTIMTAGSPGSGKTRFLEILTQELKNKAYAEKECGVISPYTQNDTFEKQIFSEYWESYFGQWRLHWDEFGQIKDVKLRGVQAMEFIQAKNSNPMPLNMAELSKKGITFFNSRMITLCTNMPSLDNIGIESVQAFLRRVDFYIHVDRVSKSTHSSNIRKEDWRFYIQGVNSRTHLEKFKFGRDYYNYESIFKMCWERLMHHDTAYKIAQLESNYEYQKAMYERMKDDPSVEDRKSVV